MCHHPDHPQIWKQLLSGCIHGASLISFWMKGGMLTSRMVAWPWHIWTELSTKHAEMTQKRYKKRNGRHENQSSRTWVRYLLHAEKNINSMDLVSFFCFITNEILGPREAQPSAEITSARETEERPEGYWADHFLSHLKLGAPKQDESRAAI